MQKQTQIKDIPYAIKLALFGRISFLTTKHAKGADHTGAPFDRICPDMIG